MDKTTIAVFIIAFWLFLPIPMMMFNIGGFDIYENESPNGINPIDWLTIYFKLLVFSIPSANIYIVFFVRFLQAMTILFLALWIRGG